MFKHAFHGGPAVEILSTSGKNPLEKWKTAGSITKSFDNQIKGYIYTLDGQSKIQIPKDEKEYLGLIQPFLVLQIFIPLGKNIHIEVGITDSTKTKRRLIFHTGAKEIVANPLHARIPVNQFRRNQWVNLSLDIFAFAHHCFKGVNIRSIDLLIVTASCKLRRIFTMKNPLYDDQEADDPELQNLINELMLEEQRDNLPFDYVPKNLGFPAGFLHFNQFIFPQRLRHSQANNPDENQNQVNVPESGPKAKIQLAFGQRIPIKGQQQPQVTKRMVQKKQSPGNKVDQEDNTQEDFYSPLISQNPMDYQGLNHDLIQDDHNDLPSKRQPNDKDAQKQRITKEDLKEETHFLYLNNSDEENDQALDNKRGKQSKNNPWDQNGRQDHDAKPTVSKNVKQSKKQSPRKLNDGKKSPIRDLVREEDKFYSPLSSRQDLPMRLDSEMSDDLLIQQQFQRVNELSTVVNNIESKYQAAQDYLKDHPQEKGISPEIHQKSKKAGQGFKKIQDNKVKLKQQQTEEEKTMTRFNNFNLEQWDHVDESSHFIEEAFEVNYQNLVNFDQKLPEPLPRKSREFKENPMYIEFELNNDDEDDATPKMTEGNNLQIFSIPPKSQTQVETNQSYQRLESSRREERRPFSPPFKLPDTNLPTSDFDSKLELLKVQRTEILRDSLDNSIPMTSQLSEVPSKATVENEDGEVLDVIFDPVLRCYYDPKSNTYYELKSKLEALNNSQYGGTSIPKQEKVDAKKEQQLKDLEDEIKSMRSQRSKQIQTVLNGLRRARLTVTAQGQNRLNPLNLAKLNSQSNTNTTSHNEGIDDTQNNDGVQEGTKNVEQSGELEVVQESVEQQGRCCLCEIEMSDNEIKVAEKLQRYSKERGDLKRLITRIRKRLDQKRNNQSTNDQLSNDAASSELPLTCFKCQYEIILGSEGRAKALRIFNVAQLELEGQPLNKQTNQIQIVKPKNRVAHEISKEMNDLGLLSGTFYDYQRQREFDLELTKSPQFAYRSSNPLVDKQFRKANNSVLVSIAREGSSSVMDISANQSITDYCTHSQLQIKKPWREDFNDKIERKFGSLERGERQMKILKKIEKERAKYLTGQKLQMENMRIMREYREQRLRKDVKSSMNKESPQMAMPDQKSEIVIVDSQRSKGISTQINKSMASTNHLYFNSQQVQDNITAYRIFSNQRKIDKTFFRKLSNLGAYANASFNGGVFVHPAQEYA